MPGCRDCSECTESLIYKLLAILWRLPIALLTFWNIGLFRRYCPQCRHRMSRHVKVRGRFMD